MEFAPLSSGSKGNSTYIGTEKTKILIDVGTSGKYIAESLLSMDIDPKHLTAIFVTHEHTDHIKGVGILSRKYDLPIYATVDTWCEMLPKIGRISLSNQKTIEPNEPIHLNELTVTPFSIPHDAVQPVGYTVSKGDKKIGVATDFGYVTEDIIYYLSQCDALLLESNHDVDMLKDGDYPYALKQRILGDYGHLSNVAVGEFIPKIYTKKTTTIFLGHLSSDNNTPLTAYTTVKKILKENNIIVNKHLKLAVAIQDVCCEKVVI